MTKIKKWHIIIVVLIIISLFSIYHYQRKKRLKELYVYFHYPGSCLYNIGFTYSCIFDIYSKTGQFPWDKEDLINMYTKYLNTDSEEYISDIRDLLNRYQYETLNINGEKIHLLTYDNIFRKYGYKFDIKIAWDDSGNLRTEYCGDIPVWKHGRLIPEPIEDHLDLNNNGAFGVSLQHF